MGAHPATYGETFFFLIFWPRHAACGILVPQPGIKPTPPALEAQSLNHWTAREVLEILFLMLMMDALTELPMKVRQDMCFYKESHRLRE